MIEYELTYLAKYIPKGLTQCKVKEIFDIYLPTNFLGHAPIRLRKNGDTYEITRKHSLDGKDHSKLVEQTIDITQKEFELLASEVKGKRVHKMRYYYPVNGRTAEVDVFVDDLAGLVLVDFEFKDDGDKSQFTMPDFCLCDVTQEDFIAGGVLCGKKYAELANELKKFKYTKLEVKK